VLRVAIAHADGGGLEALSMRRLAEELGVAPMALYRHVANKDDLVDGMVDVVFSEVGLPSGGTDWRTAMRKRAISLRDVLARHRWAIGLMESRRNPGPANLRHHDAVIGQGGPRYDLIFDNVGNHSMSATRRALTANGTLLSNGGGHSAGKLRRMIKTAIVSMFVRQQGKPSVKTQNAADLRALKELVEAGKITPVIDGTYDLRETPEAIDHVAAGHARGTVVITVGDRPVARVA